MLLSGMSAGLAQSRGYTVQVSAWRTEAEARVELGRLREHGIDAYVIRANVPGKGIYYRVRFGHFGSQAVAARAAAAARGQGIREFMIAGYDAPPAGAEVVRAAPALAIEQPRMEQAPMETARPKPAPVPPVISPNMGKPVLPVVNAPAALPVIAGVFAEVPPVPFVRVRETEVANAVREAMKRVTVPVVPETNFSVPAGAESPKKEAEIMTTDATRATGAEYNIVSTSAPMAVTIANSAWELAPAAALAGRNLRAIHFVDAARGWVASDDGQIARTDDGGGHWRVLGAIAGVNIQSLQFVNESKGWALGQSRAGEGGETIRFFCTVDGGGAWTEVTAQPEMREVARMQFVDEKNGWAVGQNATLLRTNNGGLDWTPAENIEQLFGAPLEGARYNQRFSGLSFINAEKGWAIANFHGRARTDIGGLYATSDGGRNWRRVPLPIRTPGVAPEPGISGVSGHGFASAAPGAAAARGTSVAAGRIMPGMLRTVHFSDENHGAVTGELLDSGKRWLFVLRTSDGGRSWRQSLTPGYAPSAAWFGGSARGWAAAARTAETTDAPAATLYRTEDGGAHWSPDLTLRDRRIHSLFFLSPTRGWAVGDNGTILRYEMRIPE
ncbi:MAG: YCF48-related protein [Blastocatellia bacterium]